MNHKGQLERISTANDSVVYKLTFDKVTGGSAYLFGIYKIKESSGYKTERMFIYKNDELVRGYSIVDLDSILAQMDSSNQVIDLIE